MATSPIRFLHVSRFTTVLLLIIGLFLLSSCGAGFSNPSPAQTLKKNIMDLDREHGFTAMAMWRLHIEDRTGDLLGREPKFSIGPVGAAENLCQYLATGKAREMTPGAALSSYATVMPVEGEWTEKDGNAFYDGFYVIELKPGPREFFHLRLESEDAYSEKWISIVLDAPCRVEADTLYDLNLLEVVVADRTVTSKGKVSFRYQVRAPNRKMPNQEKLARQFPDLVFPENAVTRQCVFSTSACEER